MSASSRTRESSEVSSISPISGRKKRLACDNCHLSKVRCTGEEGGCQRCKRGKKICHYSESNMGRTPLDGPSKRRKSSVQTASGSPVTDPTVTFHRQRHQSSDSPSRPFIVVGGTELRNETDIPSSTGGRKPSPFDDLNHLTNDHMRLWNQQGVEQRQDASPSALLDNIGIELPSPGFDTLLSNFEDIDFGYIDDSPFDVAETPLDLPCTATLDHHSPEVLAFPSREHQQQRNKQQLSHSDQLYQMPLPTPISDEPTTDSENRMIGLEQLEVADVSFWAAQLEELSARPHASPIQLDEMLHHSSQLFSRVTEALKNSSLSSTNLILILVCLTQTMSLFERCLPSLISGAAPTSGPSTGLSLHLGAYQIDQKVQQALQMHVVAGELSKILDICRLVKQLLSQPGWTTDSKRTHSLLLEDLQVRTKTLAYQMKQKWITGRRMGL